MGVAIPRKTLGTEVEAGRHKYMSVAQMSSWGLPSHSTHITPCRKNTEFTGHNRDLNSVSLSLSTLGSSPVGEQRKNIPGQASSFCILSPHIDLFRTLGSPLPLVQPRLPGPDIVNTDGCSNESICF